MTEFKILFYISFFILLISLALLTFHNLEESTFHPKNLNSEQNEIIFSNDSNSTHLQVLTDEGKLTKIGWSRKFEHFDFNPDRINPSTSYTKLMNNFRYKKWEAFVFIHPEFIIATAVFDLSYIGGYLIHFSNLTETETTEIISHEHLNPFYKPKIEDQCYSNCIASIFKREEFTHVQTKSVIMGNQQLNISYHEEKLNFEMQLTLKGKDYDSMVSLTPISEDSTLFYFNTKTYTLPVTGTISVNGRNYNGTDVIVAYDSGRGVWPLRSGWVWVSANGLTKSSQDRIGLNFGHGFSHPKSSNHTEDAFFINGKIFKLNSVNMTHIDENIINFESYEVDNIKNCCKVTFTTLKQKDNLVNLGFAQISFKIKHGVFKGECKDENGHIYDFENVYGIIEDKLSIW